MGRDRALCCFKCKRILTVDVEDVGRFESVLNALRVSFGTGDEPDDVAATLASVGPRTSFAAASDVPEHRDLANQLSDWALRVAGLNCPLCADCGRESTAALRSDVEELRAEREGYARMLSSAGEDAGADENQNADEDDLAAEEAALEAELALLEEQAALQTAREAALAEGDAALGALRDGLWRQQHAASFAAWDARERRESSAVQLALTQTTLDCFKRLNVCNDAFHCWFRGPFATVNGFRLGRLPSMPVEWPEINAALGQAAMLLVTIASKAQFKFSKHRIHALGSFSKISKTDDSSEASLHWDGSINPFRKRSFNTALTWFLSCLEEAGTYATLNDPTLCLPYAIRDGRINDLPITLGNDERWTRALKYAVTNLKWLVAWTAKHGDANRSQADARAVG